MIDIRYHVASLVAVFLALGLGILIGSTVIGSDVLVEQQKKMITQLENQFSTLRQREEELTTQNRFVSQINHYYEQYSQAVSPPIIKDRLRGYQVAIVVTGGQEIPAGVLNSLSLAGARVISNSVFLPAINLNDQRLKLKVCDYYQLDHNTSLDDLRKHVALSVAGIVVEGKDEKTRTFLQENNLVKFNGEYGGRLQGVLLIGGAKDKVFYHPDSIDAWIIQSLQNFDQRIVACESSQVNQSFMRSYQEFDISTVDDIDLTPGLVAMVRALEGETGDYGIKETASKFMPSLPAEFLEGAFR